MRREHRECRPQPQWELTSGRHIGLFTQTLLGSDTLSRHPVVTLVKYHQHHNLYVRGAHMKYRSLLAISLLALVGACNSTTLLTTPKLALSGQPGATLAKPVLFSITDEEAKARGPAYLSELAASICAAYPKALKLVSPEKIPVPGQVSIKIYIRQLGAYFNRANVSRMRHRPREPQLTDPGIGDWGKVIAASMTNSPNVGGYVSSPNLTGALLGIQSGWSGIAFLDIDLHDNRTGKSVSTGFSIAAERSTGNTLGYLSATANAADAWKVVQPAIKRFLEAAVDKVTQETPTGNTPNPPEHVCLDKV